MSLISTRSSCVRARRLNGRHRFSALWLTVLVTISFSSLTLVSGCGSSSATKAGVISVSYPNGVTAAQFPVLSTAAVSMIPVADSVNAGVDWTLTCGGSPLAPPVPGGASSGCGTLLPSHTASGIPATYTAPSLIPVGTMVTITAKVTSDPSQSSAVALTIANLPVVVIISSSPKSMAVSATAKLSAGLTNDTSNAGALWGCSPMGACGTFSSTQTGGGVQTTYTAPAKSPAGGTVTVTATSVANTADSTSATISILPIAVSVSPATYTVAASGTAKFTATVTNDVENSGVAWSCSPGACGSFSSATTSSGTATTYTAPATTPAGGVVTITAISAADGTTSASASATISASQVIDVTMTRTIPTSVAESKTATLGATVTGDSTNAGVDWAATCGSNAPGACGTFSPANTSSGSTTTYTAPPSLPPTNPVTITATSHAYNLNPSLVANAVSGTTTVTAPASIAFTQQPPTSVATTGQATVSASVTNDAPTGGGVTWSAVCSNTTAGACGYVTPYQTVSGQTATYIAPPTVPGVPVQIRATATAFPATSVLSTNVTVVQSTVHSIAFVPFAPSQVLQGTTVTLNAALTNDPSHAGVDWTVCGNGCGFFTIVPARPAIAAVPPSPVSPGSPYVPPVSAVTATSAPGWPNGVPITYTAPDQAPEQGTVLVTAAATTDRLNNIATPATVAASIAITSEATGPDLNGVVQAGPQPVVGASVYLYAAGTSGYASASIPIASPNATGAITTSSTGSFKIPAGYACPQLTSQVYLVAVGGQVGSSDPNPNLALMAALGACSNLSSSPVVVNEVTTVASASALAPFSADNAMTGNSSYLNIGASSTNATTGLVNAFGTVNNLVNIGTGRPLYSTLAGNATVPYVEINTLADALNACAMSSGGSAGDGSACGNLFAEANPLQTADTAAAPTDTLQAVFDLVKPPDPSISVSPQLTAIYGMVSASSPYEPILTSAPHDWSIALNYTFGGGVGGSGVTGSGSSFFALDASGNLWITNTNTNSISEWSNLGAPISPAVLSSTAGGFTPAGLNAPGPISIDANGFVWIASGNGSLAEVDGVTASPANGSPFFGGGLATPVGMAIDQSDSIWVTNSGSSGGVTKFSNYGIALSPAGGYTAGIADPLPIAVDGSNNVWIQNEIPNQQTATATDGLAELNSASGSVIALGSGSFAGSPNVRQIAVDASGRVWEPNTTCGVWVLTASTTPGVFNSTSAGAATLSGPTAVAIDGADRVWVTNTGAYNCGTGTPQPSVSLIDTANGYSFVHTSLSNSPLFLAVDGSGNLWVLLNNNTVTEFVGVATPAITPLASAVKNNKLGARP